MRYKLFPFLVFLLIVVYACDNEKQFYDGFSEEIHMEDLLIEKFSLENLYPYSNIIHYDSVLILTQGRNEFSLIQVFSEKHRNKIASFGNLGHGPNEYINPARFRLDTEHKFLWFIDYPQILLVGISLEDLILNRLEKPSVSFKFDSRVMPVWDYFVDSDTNIYFSTTHNTNSLVSISNTQGEIIDSLGEFYSEYEFTQDPHNDLYGKYMVYNKQTGDYYFFYRFYDRITKYNSLENTYENLYGPSQIDFGKPKLDGEGSLLKKRTMKKVYQFKVVGNNNSIMGLYLAGRPFNDDLSINSPREINVFDLKLNPKYKLIFNYDISSFAYNEKDAKLYVLTNTQRENVFVYDLSALHLNK